MHGGNLKELLEKRKRLMKAYRVYEPYIYPDYIERRASIPT